MCAWLIARSQYRAVRFTDVCVCVCARALFVFVCPVCVCVCPVCVCVAHNALQETFDLFIWSLFTMEVLQKMFSNPFAPVSENTGATSKTKDGS